MRAAALLLLGALAGGCDGDSFVLPPNPDLAGKPPYDIAVPGREAGVPDLAGADLLGADLLEPPDLSARDLTPAPDGATTADAG